MSRAPASVLDRDPRRTDARLVLALTAGAFVLRLGVRWIAGASQAGGYDFYLGIARTFADTGWLCESARLGCAVRMPLYPLIIRPFLTASGVSAGLVLLQAALGAGLVSVAFGITRELWGRRAALVAAGLACVSPYAVLHDTALQDTVLVDLLLSAGMWQLLTLRARSNATSAILAGLMLAAAILASARVGFIVAAMLAWTAVAGGPSLGIRFKHAAAAALAVIVCVGGWMARNAVVVGEPVLTTESGASLWAANNAQTMRYLPSESIDRSFAAALAARTNEERARLRAAGGEAAEDRVYAAMAWSYIAGHKIETAKAAALKIAVPLAAYLSPARSRFVEIGFALVYLPLHVFAFAGAWRARGKWHAHTLPLLVLAAFLLTSGIFWAHTSHAVCVDPIWFAYAAAALTGARPERDTI